MIALLRDAQLPFLALILLVASGAKLVDRSPFTLAVAVAEGVLGIALLSTRLGVVRIASVVFFATATSVVAEHARRGSEKGCGCFGTLSDAPSGRRGVLRAALMTVCAIAATDVPSTGFAVLQATATVRLVTVLAAEAAVFLALSPELAVVTGRSRRHVPCELRDVPLAETYGTLRASNAWRTNVGLLTREEPSEVWRELCHRFLAYPAEIGGRPGDVVFAVPIGGRPRSVRVGIVVDQVDETREDPLGSAV